MLPSSPPRGRIQLLNHCGSSRIFTFLLWWKWEFHIVQLQLWMHTPRMSQHGRWLALRAAFLDLHLQYCLSGNKVVMISPLGKKIHLTQCPKVWMVGMARVCFRLVEDRVWETAMKSARGSGVALVPPLQLDMPSSFDDLCKVSSSSALPCHQSNPSSTQSEDPSMSSVGSSVPTPNSQHPILVRSVSNSPLLQVSLVDGSRACASSHDVLSQAETHNPSSCRCGPCVDVPGLTSMSSWQELGSHLGSLLNQYRNAGPNPYLAEIEGKARTFQETLAQVVESQQPTVEPVEASNLDRAIKDTSPFQVQCGLSNGVTRICKSGGESEVDGSDARNGVGGSDAVSGTGGSDGVARLGDSGSGTGVDGSDRETGIGGSEDVTTMVESGGGTSVDDSDGRIRMGRMGRSDGGTATGGSDGDTELDESDGGIRTGRSDDVTGMSGSVGKTRTDGVDAGTALGRSDDVATMVDAGGRTAADESRCGIIMGRSDGGTGTGSSDGVTEMAMSDGESRMSRSDRGTTSVWISFWHRNGQLR